MKNKNFFKKVARIYEYRDKKKKFKKNKKTIKRKLIELCFYILVAGNNLEKTLEI